jgi:hypothetical protein
MEKVEVGDRKGVKNIIPQLREGHIVSFMLNEDFQD